MQRRWFKKRVLCVCLLSVFLYLIVRTRTHDVAFEVVIPNSKPVVVWDFVADFSNLKKIYPNIIDFTILSEDGNYDHWKYSARYEEFLLYFPYIRYFIDGHFNVKPAGGGTYIIQSTHNTCFLSGLFCLFTEAEFRFEQVGTNTRCVKKISYECPIASTLLCHHEVLNQQHAVMSNLQKHFSPPVMASKSM